jgi:hypothetical protein
VNQEMLGGEEVFGFGVDAGPDVLERLCLHEVAGPML